MSTVYLGCYTIFDRDFIQWHAWCESPRLTSLLKINKYWIHLKVRQTLNPWQILSVGWRNQCILMLLTARNVFSYCNNMNRMWAIPSVHTTDVLNICHILNYRDCLWLGDFTCVILFRQLNGKIDGDLHWSRLVVVGHCDDSSWCHSLVSPLLWVSIPFAWILSLLDSTFLASPTQCITSICSALHSSYLLGSRATLTI